MVCCVERSHGWRSTPNLCHPRPSRKHANTRLQRGVGDLILKRFLLLALLLDRTAARLAAARAPVPLLFRVAAPVKSSAEAVQAFLHGRLVGEGNLLRHLELQGYRLEYEQSPLAEYPYAVTNLAVDLRDGLRLVRMAELLTGAPLLGGAWEEGC